MSVLPEISLSILFYVGLWRPVEWQGWKCKLYNVYTCFCFLNGIAFILSESVELIYFNNSIFYFFDNFSMLITVIGMCGKMLTLIIGHKITMQIVNKFQEYPFNTRDEEEQLIHNKFNQIIR